MEDGILRLIELNSEIEAIRCKQIDDRSKDISDLIALSKNLLKAADECSMPPHYIIQPFMDIVKRNREIIRKYELLGEDMSICPRCEQEVSGYELCAGTIDGEPAHKQCILDELDEEGMDDFYNDG